MGKGEEVSQESLNLADNQVRESRSGAASFPLGCDGHSDSCIDFAA